MLHTLLHSRPHVREKFLVLRQTVMLADTPENSCALVLLFSPGGPRRFFDMISLGPATVRLLNVLTPLAEGGRVLLVTTAVEGVGDVGGVSRPHIPAVPIQSWAR